MGKVLETISDSIGIEIIDNSTILIGKGNELHLYHKSVTEKTFDTQTLAIKLTNKIHGIRKTENAYDKNLLIYGEKEFVLVEYNQHLNFYEVYRAELSDWIRSGLFFNQHKEFVLLTAHSIILRFSYNVAARKCCLQERVSCIDKSTLYCAHLFGDIWDELIVMAGNAFGELLIWQPLKNEKNNAGQMKPKVSPLLHRITAHNGVIFSIDYDQASQCLITTSDDRAIKWWKVEFTTDSKWTESTLQALSSGYGHLARVFQGRIITDSASIYALSVGEDSCLCLWNRNGQLLFKRRQQYGAIIWNFLYDNSNKTIYTVGSTGNLVAFGLKQVLKETQNPKNAILLPTLTDDTSVKYIAKVKFVNENLLLGVTNENNLMTSKFTGEEWHSWESSTVKLGFKCTVIEVYQNIIAICGFKRLKLLEYEEHREDFSVLHDEDVLKGLIRTFIFFSKQDYLMCDDQGGCIFFSSIRNKRYLKLPTCKERWLTAALLLNQQQHIAISNRQGNLLLYQLNQDTNIYELKDFIKHPHGHLGATYLNCVEEKLASALIRSTGHDGALNVFAVDFINSAIKTCSRQIIPVAWAERIEKCGNDLDLFLGFNDNHFVVWCKEYDFLLEIHCGGGHRCWHFVRNPKTETISMVFIKNKRVRFYRMPLLNKELTTLPVAKRWHIAPCNTFQILPQTSCSHHIAVTAGDDNLLKIHTFNMQTGLIERKEMHGHISNIRCVKLLSLNENEFLVFSGGGRAQLCVTKVNSRNFHINELINHTLKQDNRNNFNSKSFNFDPETRLMSLDVKALNKEEYDVYVGCSDGFIKRLKLNLKTFDILLLAQYFHSKCILQIRYVPETDLILIAATNGILKFFDSTLSKCLYQLQHHATGINGLSVLCDISNKKSLHILSGGDDQAVSYTELSVKNEDFRVIRQIRKPYLHTSQVCACALSSNGLYGFTSGVDQVLNKIDLSTGEVLDRYYSCVADIKGVALIDDNVCLLYGCGFQSYAFNK